ncbi:hypothetical protein [Paraburkholderia sp. BL18I3N2]|nr:hypothetical protein [Paraburkholderia sp. BL18I3N2]
MPRQIIDFLSRLRQIANDRADCFTSSHIVMVDPTYADIDTKYVTIGLSQ